MSYANQAQRIADGLCRHCPAPAREGVTTCASCAAKRKALYAGRKRVKQCVNCSNPAITGKTMCGECLSKTSVRGTNHFIKRKAAGICHACPAPAPKGKTKCDKCAAKTTARTIKRSAIRRTAATAGMFSNQGGRCAGCRHPFPQRCLSVDHIHPRSKGGSDDPSNLQLLCQYCNSVKLNRTQSDLLADLRERGIIDADGNNIEVGYVAG